jgi:hypothetical protein
MGGGSLRGGGPVVPCIAGAQQGLKGSGLVGEGWYPGYLWDQLQAGVWRGLVVGILVVVDLVVQLRGRYPAMCGSGAGLWLGSTHSMF